MHITPEMIREQRFKVKLSGGFDKEEVVNFLVGVAEDMEEIAEENSLLKSELEAMRSKQRDLEDIFLSAKQFSDEKKRLSEEEASATVAEARNTAAAMLAEAQQKIDEAEQRGQELEDEARARAREIIEASEQAKEALEKEILELKVKKMNLFAELKGVMDSYQNWLKELGNVDQGR
ncbi:MAG TPA: DivIVA domain-containing protein [Deltaproteobacteria bacterium]|nr:DivIVA domain-containing protein [Deltaproteobacteria bacterium]HOI06413.1 DivIVA domain-containing protein [Deltaproteobacteria bacterium]